jgi:adenylate cyclase
MGEIRKLAAIMFTDIVGYSALMAKDEKLAMSILKKNKEIHKIAVRKFDGEYIKEIGDGTLSIFQSSFNAVFCAIEIQNICSKESLFRLRVGIHTGDIISKDGDVFGDGVNIASRLEAICEPGGIFITETVYNDIKNKAGIEAEFIGEKSLKNIDQPLKVYAIAAEYFNHSMEQEKAGQKIHNQPEEDNYKISPVRSNRRLYVGIAAVIIIAIILSAGYLLLHKKTGINISRTDTEESLKNKGGSIWTNSIAVLPFTDLSPEKDQEYFCDGMSEELINVLTNIPELKVVARTSAFSFKGKEIDVREIGKKLDVKTILEGSVRKSGNQLRISAQLIDVKNGYDLWSQTYNRELKDVFAIQDEISSAIVVALKTKLLPEEKRKIEKKQTGNAEAFQLYLEGRFYWNKRNRDGFEKAIQYFNQAIGKDSLYAVAYAGLADAYETMGSYFFLSPKESVDNAQFAARKALALDETLAEPHTTLAALFEIDWDWTNAEKEYKHALELNSNYVTGHQWYGEFLVETGRFNDGLSELKKAQELDPLSPILYVSMADFLDGMHRYEEGTQQIMKALEIDQNFSRAHAVLGQLYLYKGAGGDAIREIRKAIELSDSSLEYVANLGYTYGFLGQKEESEKILRKFVQLEKQQYVSPYLIGELYLGIGEKDEAFVWFNRAIEKHDFGMLNLKIDPIFDVIRGDPRFDELIKKVGLQQ